MSRTQLIKTYNKNTDWTWQSIYTSLKTIIRQVTDPRVLQLFATSNAKTYKKKIMYLRLIYQSVYNVYNNNILYDFNYLYFVWP